MKTQEQFEQLFTCRSSAAEFLRAVSTARESLAAWWRQEAEYDRNPRENSYARDARRATLDAHEYRTRLLAEKEGKTLRQLEEELRAVEVSA